MLHLNASKVLLVVFLVVSTWTISLSQSVSVTKVAEVELNNDYRIGGIFKLIKAGQNYVFIDHIANKVYVLDDKLGIDYVFDHESCHPGVPFNPKKLTKIDETKVLISSTPIFGYLLEPATRKCSTREAGDTRFRGAEYLASTNDGLIGVLQFPDKTLHFYVWDKDLKMINSMAMNDDLPFFNIRYRLVSDEKLLYMNNQIMYLNQFDFTIMYLDIDTFKSNNVSRRITHLPIRRFNKITQDVGANNLEKMNPQAIINTVAKKSIVKAIRKLDNNTIFLEISDSEDGIVYTYTCDVNMTKCSELNYNKDGGTIFAGDGEFINSKNGGDNPILIKYVVTQK